MTPHSPESQRNYLRRLISAHPQWPSLKLRDNLNIASLSMATITRICLELGIDTTQSPPPRIGRVQLPDDTTPAKITLDTDPETAPEIVLAGQGRIYVKDDTKLDTDETDAEMPKTITRRDTLNGLSEAEAQILIAVREANRVAALEAASKAQTDEARVIELIELHAPKPSQVAISIARGPDIQKTEGLFHYKFALIVTAIASGLNVMLVGPAGSGKTTLGEQVARSLGFRFYFNGAIASEYKLSGFIDAQGRIIATAFRKAYIEGGLYLFDEIDASMPQALLAFNAALSNGHADFPDGNFTRHPDFRCMAAANTFGSGASRLYVGRNQLDAASLDRFITIDLDYDTALEAAILGCPRPKDAPRPISIEARPESDVTIETPLIVARIRRIRQAIDKLNASIGGKDAAIRHVVSPRASMAYVKLYAAGWDKDTIDQSVIWKGCEKLTRDKIEAAL